LGLSPLSLPSLSPELCRYSDHCFRPPDHGLELVPSPPDRHPSRLSIAPSAQEPAQLSQLAEELTYGPRRRGSPVPHGSQCPDVRGGNHLFRGTLGRCARFSLQLEQ